MSLATMPLDWTKRCAHRGATPQWGAPARGAIIVAPNCNREATKWIIHTAERGLLSVSQKSLVVDDWTSFCSVKMLKKFLPLRESEVIYLRTV